MNGVGEPCAGEPHARFDWGRLDDNRRTPVRLQPPTSLSRKSQSRWTQFELELGLDGEHMFW